MRQRDFLSPEEQRELDALEGALAGDPVEFDLRELEELVHDIRATAPEMSPGFAARLEHEVAEGFPQSVERPARRRPRRWVLIPAGGVLAAALVALVVVLGRGGPDDGAVVGTASEQVSTGAGAGAGAAADSASPSRAAKAPLVAAPAPAPESSTSTVSSSSGGGIVLGPAARSQAQKGAPSATASASASAPRKQERSAQLVLRVPNAKVDETSDAVIRTIDRFRGIVASSSSATQGSHGEADFELRIPTDKLDDALAALSRLGHVTERQQNLVDITGSFTSAEDRLSDARAERRGLLKALGRATTQQQIDSLKARLSNVRSRIARLNGDLDALRRRADLSSVSLTVRGTAAQAGGGTDAGGGGWSPGDAAHDALRVLEVIAGVALIALAIAAPLGLLAALVALAVRMARRRRREGALDPA